MSKLTYQDKINIKKKKKKQQCENISKKYGVRKRNVWIME